MKKATGALVVGYPDLTNYNTVDEVLGPSTSCVILYETRANVGHWVCLFKRDDETLEFFDSFGEKPDRQLKHVSTHFRHVLGEQVPLLTHLLNQSPYKTIIFNNVKLQRQSSSINTCGRYCVLRLLKRKLTIEQFRKLLTREGQTPDEVVTELTDWM